MNDNRQTYCIPSEQPRRLTQITQSIPHKLPTSAILPLLSLKYLCLDCSN